MKENGKATYDAERAVRLGLDVIGCLLTDPGLWDEAGSLEAENFQSDDQRRTFGAIAFLHKHGCAADIVSVSSQLGGKVLEEHLGSFVHGAVPENFKSYVRCLQEVARELKFQRLQAALAEATSREDRLAYLDMLRNTLDQKTHGQNWRGIFHSYEEFKNAPPLRFAIDGFLQEGGVTLIGGLAGHGKTFLMLAMAKALLEQSPLFGHERFTVPDPAQRVLYLIPESSLGPFWSRIQLFRLQEFVRSDRLLVRTLSSREQVSLDDPRVLTAAAGADVFLDTAVRFMDGSENDVESARPFADTLFRLLNTGARSITGAHHSPKSFEGQDYMTLENILRGSGDIGAMLCICWGVRQIDPVRNQLFVGNCKARDFQSCGPFILEGRPHLDTTGQFKMIAEPGEAEELRSCLRQKGRAGRPVTADKDDKVSQAVELRAKRLGVREIAKTVGVGKSTVDRWLVDYDASQKCPTVGQFRDKAEPDGETANKRCSPPSGDFEVSHNSRY